MFQFFFLGGGLTFLAPTRSSGSYFVCLCVPFVNSELFLHAVSWLSLDSLSAVSQLSLSCLSDVFQLSFSCLSAVSQLSLSCLSAASQLSFSCLSAVYELSSKRKSSYPSKLSLCAVWWYDMYSNWKQRMRETAPSKEILPEVQRNKLFKGHTEVILVAAFNRKLSNRKATISN